MQKKSWTLRSKRCPAPARQKRLGVLQGLLGILLLALVAGDAAAQGTDGQDLVEPVSLEGRVGLSRGESQQLRAGVGPAPPLGPISIGEWVNDAATRTDVVNAKRATQSELRTNGSGAAELASALSAGGAPEIVELARALKGDPDLIYEYVYNNIQTPPLYGSRKGALGALIERVGTDADQAELMVALLREAALANPRITNPQFVTGPIWLTRNQLMNWFGAYGTSNTYSSLGQMIANGGFPVSAAYASSAGTHAICFAIQHVWVQVSIDGTPYVFDSSTKLSTQPVAELANENNICNTTGAQPSGVAYDVSSGIDLMAATQYNRANLMARALNGASVNANSVTNMNRANIRTDLPGYANNLAAWIRANKPGASTIEVVGGRTIKPIPTDTHQRWLTLPYSCSPAKYAACAAPVATATLPSSLRATLTVTLPGASAVTFNAADLNATRLTISFDASNRPLLIWDGVVQSTGVVTPAGAWADVTLRIRNPGGSSFDWSVTKSTVPGNKYAVVGWWGPVGRGAVEHRRRRLSLEREAGANPQSEPMWGEGLMQLGQTYAAEMSQMTELMSEINGMTPFIQGSVGLFAVQQLNGSTTPLIDLGITVTWLTQRAPNRIPVSGQSISASEIRALNAKSEFASVLEGGVLEQSEPGLAGVSTTRLIDQAMQSDTIFDINNPATPGNDAAYWTSTVKPIFNAYWTGGSAGALSELNADVVTGLRRVVAPMRGPQTVGMWTGAAWFILPPWGGMGGSIGGGHAGGSGTAPVTVDAVVSNALFTQSAAGQSQVGSYISLLATYSGGDASGRGAPLSLDPVNLVTGAFQADHADLTVGGEYPYGLSFERHYDSSSRLAAAGPLGRGWSHNFASFAQPGSDGFVGLASDSPISGAAAISAQFIIADLLDTPGPPPLDRLLASVATTRWLMDQITNNLVTLQMPGSSQAFAKLADGTYNPPVGSNGALSLTGGLYTYAAAGQDKYNFAVDGKLSTIKYAAGPTVTLGYDASRKLVSVSNGMGRSLNLIYTGQQITQVSAGVRQISFGYDASSNLTSYKDASNHTTIYGYDLPGRLTRIYYPSFPTNPFVANTYGALDRVESQLDANGRVTKFFLAGSRAETVNAEGKTDILYLSRRGKTQTHIDALNNRTIYTYDGIDRLALVTHPELNSTAYTYDNAHGTTALQNVLSVAKNPKPGSGSPVIVTSYTYDSIFNKVKTATDPNGNVTTSFYDPVTGNLLEVDQPVVSGQIPKTFFTYNARGQVLTKIDPKGKITAYTYDAATEARLSVTDDDANFKIKTQYGYDPAGNVASVTDPNNNTTTFLYDGMRRVTQVTGPTSIGAITKTTYSPDGQVVQVQGATGNTSSPWKTSSATYSYSGKTLTATDGNNHTTTYTYDVMDRRASRTDPDGRVTRYGYDELGRARSEVNLAIQTAPLVEYTYTANGQRRTLKDANSNLSTNVYDGQDRLVRLQYPLPARGAGASDLANYEAYTHDANGNTLTHRTRDGTVITMVYDALSRITSRQYPDHVKDVHYGYDIVGRQTYAHFDSPTGVGVDYVYDTAGRITGEATSEAGFSKSLVYAYDAVGNRTRVTWPDSLYVAYDYDAANRLTAVRENGAATGVGVLASYTFDPLGRRTSILRGNQTSTSATYDAADMLTRLVHTMSAPGASGNLDLAFGYSPGNQLTTRTNSNGLYDWVNPSGATVDATADGLNRDAAIAAVPNGYDANGNQGLDASRSFSFDKDNRLTGVTKSATVVSLGYDPIGRLQRQQISVGGGAATITRFVHSGQDLLAEYDGTGVLLRRYVAGIGGDRPITWYEGAGTTDRRWFHADERGSIIAESDGAGEVTQVHTYGPYGEPGTWVGSRFAYTGQIQIAEAQLYSYKARSYDPSVGRFLQSDPIRYGGGVNLYAYANGNPLRWIDPKGTIAELSTVSFTGGRYVNQLKLGNDAHRTLQVYGTSRDSSYFAEQTAPPFPQTGWFGGRVDLGTTVGNSIYEIKPNNPGGMFAGRVQLEFYSMMQNSSSAGSSDNYHPAESTPSFMPGGAVGLTGQFAAYDYAFRGEGLITYDFQMREGFIYQPLPVRVPDLQLEFPTLPAPLTPLPMPPPLPIPL